MEFYSASKDSSIETCNNLNILYKVVENKSIVSESRYVGSGRWEREGCTGHKETFDGDGYIHYLDCGDSFIDIYTSEK